MKYSDFEHVLSPSRMSRYFSACGCNTAKAMTLYRRNLLLSQELFTIISCFEIALRNAVDRHYSSRYGPDWLRQSVYHGGMLHNQACRVAAETVKDALRKLGPRYTHHKLVAELGFGFWRYMFAPHQFAAGGRSLLAIFPAKPQSSSIMQYNASYVFNQLSDINNIRNRIAHHEPVCFRLSLKDTSYARHHYNQITQLLNWMNIDEKSLLYGLDHISIILNKIDSL